MTELLGHYHRYLMNALRILNPKQQLAADPAHMWQLLVKFFKLQSIFFQGYQKNLTVYLFTFDTQKMKNIFFN